MTNVPVLKFLFRSEWKVLTDAIQIAPVYETGEFSSANELTTFLSESSAGMIVVSLKDKNDLIQLATLMKLIKKIAAKPTFIKVIVVNFAGDKQFEKAVAKLGLDLLEEKIQTKALRFKIDFMMKSINAQIKKNATVIANTTKTLESNKNQDKKIVESKALFVNSIECEDDMWLLRNEADCKTVLTRWLVKLLGPSPYVASWVDSGNPGIWKFEFKSKNSDFVYGTGSWFYRGDQKPDFIWSENIWSFTGNSFDLFYKDGNDIFSRLRLKDKQLVIAKNSEYAKMKEKDIIESFDKDLLFKKEIQANKEKEAFENEADKLKNLDGKGKTDTLDQGPLSGKGSTDTLIQPPLSGHGKTSHSSTNPLSLELGPGENTSSNDPHAQKTATNKSSSFWKGKNEYADDFQGGLDAPADQDIRSGEELGLKTKKTHETFYKNHNETDKYEPNDKDDHSLNKSGVSENLRGKVDPSKSSSKDGSELGGKSSTDQLQGHLTSPNARKEKEVSERAEKERAEAERADKDKHGKSSTDKLSSHLSSPNGKQDGQGTSEKERAEVERADKDKHGKSSTDKLSSHLSSPNARKDGQGTSEKEKAESSNDKSTEASDRPSAEKMANHLAALRQKKEKIEKEKEAQDAVLSDVKSLGRANEKNDLSTSEQELKNRPKKQEGVKNGENVLPFASKGSSPLDQDDDLGSKALEDAVQTGKVTSYLIQESVKALGQLDDFFDQTIIFNTKQSGILEGKPISLNLKFDYMNKETNVNLKGAVSQVASDGEGSQYITVQISPESASDFNVFMKVYKTRQENINLFLKTAKGY